MMKDESILKLSLLY